MVNDIVHFGVKGMKWGVRKKLKMERKADKQLNKASYSYFQSRSSAKYDPKQSKRWRKAGDRRVAKAKSCWKRLEVPELTDYIRWHPQTGMSGGNNMGTIPYRSDE